MMNIKSLDERIRSKARKELRQEIEVIALKFKRALGVEHTHIIVKVKTHGAGDHVSVDMRRAIDKFVDDAVSDKAPKVEDSAVAEFIRQAEALQDQIDELKQ